MTDSVGEDRAEQAHCARRGTPATSHLREPVQAGFDPCGCGAFGNSVHEPLEVLALDRCNPHAAEQRLDVPLDPPAIGGQRAGFLRRLAPRQQSARLGVGQVEVA